MEIPRPQEELEENLNPIGSQGPKKKAYPARKVFFKKNHPINLYAAIGCFNHMGEVVCIPCATRDFEFDYILQLFWIIHESLKNHHMSMSIAHPS